jgi:hypothetical protein
VVSRDSGTCARARAGDGGGHVTQSRVMMLSKVCDRSRIHKVEDYLHSSPATSLKETTLPCLISLVCTTIYYSYL